MSDGDRSRVAPLLLEAARRWNVSGTAPRRAPGVHPEILLVSKRIAERRSGPVPVLRNPWELPVEKTCVVGIDGGALSPLASALTKRFQGHRGANCAPRCRALAPGDVEGEFGQQPAGRRAEHAVGQAALGVIAHDQGWADRAIADDPPCGTAGPGMPRSRVPVNGVRGFALLRPGWLAHLHSGLLGCGRHRLRLRPSVLRGRRKSWP